MGKGAQVPALRFTAVVQIAGINPFVDVPDETVAALGLPEKAPVVVRLEPTAAARPLAPPEMERLARIGRLASEGAFRTTLIPLHREPTRLYLDQYMRQAAGLAVGDTAVITLSPDPHGRDLPLPLLLGEALAADPQLQAAWEAQTASRRREILKYLNFLKTPEALERNVARVIGDLREKER